MGELHTGKKSSESVGGLIRALRFLRSNFGEVHVNFGDPIILDRFLDQKAPDWRENALGEQEMPEWFRDTINELGQRVATGINAAAVANPVNLLSLALLATPKHTMDIAQLRRQLRLYVTLLREAPYSAGSALAETDPDRIIEYGLDNGFLQRIEHELGDLVTTDARTALQMAYVRNNSLHLFVLPGLICSLFLNARSIERDQLGRLVHLLYPFFQQEYFLHWADAELDATIDNVLGVLEEQGLIQREQDSFQGAPLNSPESDLLEHLGNAVMPALERFYLTIRLLVQYGDGRMDASELEQLAHQTAHRMSLLYEFNSPEFFDKTVLRNFIQQLQLHGLTEADDQDKLHFNGQLTTLDEEAQRILSPHVSQSIQRITRREEKK
jgi:glycerol-3-phosphate O-acyltransferase